MCRRGQYDFMHYSEFETEAKILANEALHSEKYIAIGLGLLAIILRSY